MNVYKSIKPVLKRIDAIKTKGRSIGFVPTMGCLHDGHLSLVRKARGETDYVVLSIFVNPIQFTPGEDFKKYPRALKRDLEFSMDNGVDVVFVPSVKSMYGEGFSTYVGVEKLTDGLCGTSRPGHFRGVTTVVAKLFNIIKPDIAYFGQKDLQQAIVIRKMAEDLNVPVKVKVMPTIREKDGLAVSSRNLYLNSQERKEALSIYRSLELARALYRKRERDSKKIIRRMRSLITKEKHAKIDYISIVDTGSLENVDKVSKKTLVAVAVWIGRTRLIDNIILN